MQQIIEDRTVALEEAFRYNKVENEEEYIGLPVVRDRLHYSFIWDRFSLFTVDTNAILDGGIRIDPTNKNINLKAEIGKLIKKTNVTANATGLLGKKGAKDDAGDTTDNLSNMNP